MSTTPAKKQNTGAEKITIGYWKIRGLVAPIKYVLEYLKVDYDEHQYEQRADFETRNEDWFEVKFNLGLDFPNLPYLLQGDYKITESLAIIKYVCSAYSPEMLGKDPKDVGIVNMMEGTLRDIKTKVSHHCYADGNRKAATEFILEKMGRISQFMEKRRFVAGDYVTFVDFILFENGELFDFICDGAFYKSFPALKAHHDSVAALPSFAEYLRSSRFLSRPFNNTFAKINN